MDTYTELANILRHRMASLAHNQQLWIGLAGAPGSGKSTIAQELKAQIGEQLLVIPQDGYHYYRHELDTMDNPTYMHVRRGASFTFNADKLVADLVTARQKGEGCFPSFDHGVGDPVENDIHLSRQHRVIIVEGSFLLLDEPPWCNLKTHVFDESWFINISLDESNRRVTGRHVSLGLTPEQASQRVAANDGINAELITKVSPANADRLICI
jgi:pantothenate kinase